MNAPISLHDHVRYTNQADDSDVVFQVVQVFPEFEAVDLAYGGERVRYMVDVADLVRVDDDDDESESESRCPVCAEPIDYCQGHGEIGDPDGFAVLQAHDADDHSMCHPEGCEFLDLLQATIEGDGVRGVAGLLASSRRPQVPEGYALVRVDDLAEVLTSNMAPNEDYADHYADQDDPDDDGIKAQRAAQEGWDRLCDAARVTHGIPYRIPTE